MFSALFFVCFASLGADLSFSVDSDADYYQGTFEYALPATAKGHCPRRFYGKMIMEASGRIKEVSIGGESLSGFSSPKLSVPAKVTFFKVVMEGIKDGVPVFYGEATLDREVRSQALEVKSKFGYVCRVVLFPLGDRKPEEMRMMAGNNLRFYQMDLGGFFIWLAKGQTEGYRIFSIKEEGVLSSGKL